MSVNKKRHKGVEFSRRLSLQKECLPPLLVFFPAFVCGCTNNVTNRMFWCR